MKNIWRGLFAFHDRRPSDLGAALSVGTTITVRFFLSLFSLQLALQLGLDQPSLFSHAGIQMFFQFVPSYVWVIVLTFSGGLMLWRVLSRVSTPWIAWFSNGLAVATWGSIVLIRVSIIGTVSLASSSTVILLMAVWCLLRTEATERDSETA